MDEPRRSKFPLLGYLFIVASLITFAGIQTHAVYSLQTQNDAATHSREEMARQLAVAKERMATMDAELSMSATQTSAFAKEAVSLTSVAKLKIDTCISSLDATISKLTSLAKDSPLMVQVDPACYEAQKLIKDLQGMVK